MLNRNIISFINLNFLFVSAHNTFKEKINNEINPYFFGVLTMVMIQQKSERVLALWSMGKVDGSRIEGPGFYSHVRQSFLPN